MPLPPKLTWRTVELGDTAHERDATLGKAKAEVARKERRENDEDFMGNSLASLLGFANPFKDSFFALSQFAHGLQ